MMGEMEPARLALYNRLGEVIGPEHTEALITSLPMKQVWRLAAKQDVARVERGVNELRSEIRDIHKALHRQLIAVIGAMTALTAIFSVIVGLVT